MLLFLFGTDKGMKSLDPGLKYPYKLPNQTVLIDLLIDFNDMSTCLGFFMPRH